VGGICQCGCKLSAPVAKRTNTGHGHIKGEFTRYRVGHRPGRHPIDGPANPGGLCGCGCGRPAPLARVTISARGIIAGQPQKFINGHQFDYGRAKAHQRARARKREAQMARQRIPCWGCFERRPRLAFLDGTQHCVVCVARQRRQQLVDQQLQEAEREKLRRRRDADLQRTATIDANGTRYVGRAQTLKS
jgi:hypothetical protein